jgi:hypothetical protein
MIVKILTHMHKMLYTWWCWHICKGEVVGVDLDQLGEVGEEKEKKRASLGCSRSENATKVVANAQPSLGGGTSLSCVHRTPQCGGTTTPCTVHRHPLQRAHFSSTTLSYFGHNS